MWVPPKVHADLLDERKRVDAATVKGLELLAELRQFNDELQKIDPHLELVRASPNTDHPDIRPGFYHLIRHNPTAPVMVEVLEGPNGEFVEPGSNVFDLVEKSDMWSARAMKLRQKKELDAARSKQRERDLEAEQRVFEIGDRLRSLNGSQILVRRDLHG